MINQAEILTEVEKILSNHWTDIVLPREQLGQPPENGVTWADVAIVLLACVLLMVVGWRLM